MIQYPITNNAGDKDKDWKLLTPPVYIIKYPIRIKVIPIKKSQ